MIAYLSAHNFRLSANLHGGAEVMNYPWDSFTSTAYPHIAADWWHAVGLRFVDTARLVDNSRFLDVCDEGVITGGDWYVIDGGRQDYVNYYHNCLEMTMELSSDKIVQSNRLPQYWRILAKPLINYIGEIHTAPNICGIPSIERSKLTVFPNPTKGKVTVTGLDSKVKLELLDMMGRNLPLPIVSRHEKEAILDLGELAPGLYLLRTPEGSAKLLKR